MTRADLQWLARERIREAKALLAARCWSGAYYLVGYAVEVGLKSCIIKHVMATDQFPDRRFSEQCWTHDLAQLLVLAGLKGAFNLDAAADPALWANWEIVRAWRETSRYERTAKAMALAMYRAVTDAKHGVMPWIKCRW